MRIETEGARWFLAQVRPNAGRIAERNLARQGFATFLPLEPVTRRVRNRYSEVLRPLFPGYLFVSVEEGSGRWRAISSTLGIVRIVRFGEAPAPVPGALVDSLRARCDDGGRLRPPAAYAVGDRVRIGPGPLADFVATVERIEPDRRVWLLIDLMGGQTRVQARTDQLCPA